MTNFPDIFSVTLQRLADGLIYCIRRKDGTLPRDAPFAFSDSGNNPRPTWVPESSSLPKGREVRIEIRINPDGLTAWAEVESLSPRGVEAIHGQVDVALLSQLLTPG